MAKTEVLLVCIAIAGCTYASPKCDWHGVTGWVEPGSYNGLHVGSHSGFKVTEDAKVAHKTAENYHHVAPETEVQVFITQSDEVMMLFYGEQLNATQSQQFVHATFAELGLPGPMRPFTVDWSHPPCIS